jgi:hypothetical protein
MAGAALVAALAAGCSAGPATTPTAGAFAPGTCRDAAPALLGLHATARRVLRARHPDLAAAAADVKARQQTLIALRRNASADLAKPLEDIVVAAGFFRIRVDSRTFDDSLARSLDAAYAGVVRRCVSPSPGR